MRACIICLCRFAGPLKCAVRVARELTHKIDLRLILSAQADPALLPSDLDATYISTGSSRWGNIACTLNPLAYLNAARIVHSFEPDVVHFAVEHAWNPILQPMLRRYPRVQTIHDPTRHLGESSRFYDLVRRVELRQCDRFIVLSEASRASLGEQIASPNQIDVVEHGAFEFDDQAWDHGHFPSPPLRSNILFAGRFSPYKGIDILLRAFEKVVQLRPHATLTMAGKGDVAKYAQLLERIPHITLINRYVTEAEIARLHAECDFVVAPYIEATQSGVVSMALSNGRPVVATRVGALPEQVEDGITGILVDPNNIDQLTAAMLSLIDQPNRVLSLGISGRERFTQRYGWPALAEKTVEVYRTAIKSNSRCGR
jgi:glycosyltransferase involved in cell wall biosynthesis